MSTVIASGAAGQVPFFIAGGLLALWAVVLAFLGLRRPSFPDSQGASVATMALTGVLMVATMATGVATAEKPAEHEAGREGVSHGTGERQTPAEGQEGGTPGGRPARPSETGQAPAGRTLTVTADPEGELRYVQQSLAAKAGSVKIEFANRSPVSHDVKIARGSRTIGGTAVIRSSSATADVQLQPGSYTFFCSVPGHRQAGMEGPLRVSP